MQPGASPQATRSRCSDRSSSDRPVRDPATSGKQPHLVSVFGPWLTPRSGEAARVQDESELLDGARDRRLVEPGVAEQQDRGVGEGAGAVVAERAQLQAAVGGRVAESLLVVALR